MTTESPLGIVHEVLGEHDIITPDDLAAIDRRRAQGKSLGASVASYLQDAAHGFFSHLGQRITDEPDLDLGYVNSQLIAIIYYVMPQNAFLDAEEIVRSGEPEPPLPSSEETKIMSELVNTSMGLPENLESESTLTLIAETQLYLRKLRLGSILRSTNSPVIVIDHATQEILQGLEKGALRVSREDSDNMVARRNLAIAAFSVLHS